MSNEVIVHAPSQQEIQRLAKAMVTSGMFGIKDENQALMLMSIAVADGLHPATVARDYSIIQGTAAKKSEAILRDYQRSGGRVEWHVRTDTECSATFHHPSSTPLKVEWTIERATKAGLTSKDNWKKYPRQMLSARVASEGCRATAPGSTGGMYTPEEVADFEPAQREQISITAAVEQAAQVQYAPDVLANQQEICNATSVEALQAAFKAALASSNDGAAWAVYKDSYERTKTQIAEVTAREQAENA
jgi:hypothetical protein